MATPSTPPAAAGAKTGKAAAAGGAKPGKAATAGTKKKKPRSLRSTATAAKVAVKGIPNPRIRPPRRATAKDAGGFLLGLVLHSLVVSYIRYGKAGPTGWMKAKFLNKPVQGEDLDPKGPNGEEAAEGKIDPTKPII